MRTSNYISHYYKYPKIYIGITLKICSNGLACTSTRITLFASLVSAIGSIKNDKGIGDKYGIYGVS
ncbi:hypothetical protein SAMN02746098_02613 [Desulfosporosinus lacus DSM 15449]|uniref:Uncharacterized protein n=1 Tax=Desulfosporosinus lacus DSM 15449 TaxID=1121420 RepID=A0A1M5YPL0_9FIRM|nr:hypothetical protein SAMN02746098_02613 [Desulfosporosinus lacus DSM 15449]